MKIINKFFHFKILYIFFVFLSLIIFFFSTVKSEGKAFEINNIDISQPFEINFDKNEVISEGFKKAFFELISLITKSEDRKKINSIKLTEIKAMIETFSIKEEKFIEETYYVNLGVSFNRKKILNYLNKKNIFSSVPLKTKIIFIPIIIDENKNELVVFSNNIIFNKWNDYTQSFHLIDYILPTEDLEDLNLIKSKYENIEQFDFKEIISKYSLEDSIIALIFKNNKDLRILSKINIQKNVILKNQTFLDIDINNNAQISEIIPKLKTIYEDYWKTTNEINTSIKLPLTIKVDNNNNLKIQKFEKILNETDLIYDFIIQKFNKDFIYYQIIFNGTPDIFLETMSDENYVFDTQNKIWHLK